MLCLKKKIRKIGCIQNFVNFSNFLINYRYSTRINTTFIG